MQRIELAMEAEIGKYKKFLKEAEVSVFFSDLVSCKMFGINHNNAGWAASIIKVPVMMEYFYLIDSQKIRLEDRLKIRHDYALGKSRLLWMPDRAEITIENLISLMIIESDNLAANMLIDSIGLSEINHLTGMLGCDNTKISHLLLKGANIEYPGVGGKEWNE